MDQEDTYPRKVTVSGMPVIYVNQTLILTVMLMVAMLLHLSQNSGEARFNNPCNSDNVCNGDFDCDHDVDGTDVPL